MSSKILTKVRRLRTKLIPKQATEMHPEIKNFWESTGCTVEEVPDDNYPNGKVFCKIDSDTYTMSIVARYNVAGEFIYIFYGPKTEKEMLRIVKLKAFL